jgi:Spx/MgsR family transcriptional regulator
MCLDDFMLKFYWYSKCDTCRRAKKWLEAKGKKFQEIDITLNPPKLDELNTYLKRSGKELKDFLNRSGVQYRALNMKEKVKSLPPEKILAMLAKEGRLIKRPIVTDGNKVTVGFDETDFASTWK